MKLDAYKFKVACAVAGTTQAGVARHIGKTQGWFSSLKRGNFTPKEKDLKAITKFLSCKIENLFVTEKKSKGE